MKKLFLIRHAKASQDLVNFEDFKRPLIYPGIKKTNKIIKYLQENNVTFDCIISSPATRAVGTALLIAKGLDFEKNNIVYDQRIYESDEVTFFDILSELNNSFSKVAIVGHNPELKLFANTFIKENLISFPTSGVVCIEFDTDKWNKINKAAYKVLFVIFPKAL